MVNHVLYTCLSLLLKEKEVGAVFSQLTKKYNWGIYICKAGEDQFVTPCTVRGLIWKHTLSLCLGLGRSCMIILSRFICSSECPFIVRYCSALISLAGADPDRVLGVVTPPALNLVNYSKKNFSEYPYYMDAIYLYLRSPNNSASCQTSTCLT
jgi:hypothetical protein